MKKTNKIIVLFIGVCISYLYINTFLHLVPVVCIHEFIWYDLFPVTNLQNVIKQDSDVSSMRLYQS